MCIPISLSRVVDSSPLKMPLSVTSLKSIGEAIDKHEGKTGTLKRIAAALGVEPEELFCEDCRKCMFLKNYYRKKRGHLIPDEGIDEDYSYRKHADPDDEGILYDNLD